MSDNSFVNGVLLHGVHVACKLPTFGAAVAVAIPVHTVRRHAIAPVLHQLE
jgi:hypothetical protein